jgi:choline-glycine betaine transporter
VVVGVVVVVLVVAMVLLQQTIMQIQALTVVPTAHCYLIYLVALLEICSSFKSKAPVLIKETKYNMEIRPSVLLCS